MGDASAADGRSWASVKARLEAANPAATIALERAKSRRDNVFLICSSAGGRRRHCTLDMRCPALLVLAPPHLHRFRVALDPPVLRVEMQLAVDFPGDVGKLQHRNGNVADRDRSVELLPFADSRDKVREMSIGHGIAAQEVSRRGRTASLEFARPIPFEIVYLVAIAIDQHRAGRSHDQRTTITAVILHSLAALSLPR